METILESLLREEKELQFAEFNEETSWKLGTWIVDYAREKELSISVDIKLNGRQLFHAALPGTGADNDEWIKRKVRLVNRFAHSSFYMGQLLKSMNTTIEDTYLLAESEYAPHGGSFPIIIKGTGAVGTITVSGLAQEEDHKLVVEAIRANIA